MRDTNLVLAGSALALRDDFLDLGREYIDTLDLHHIIGAALNDIDARVCSAACALARDDAGQVVCAVTDERSSFLHERCDDNLAPLAVRQVLSGLRIDDLEVNIVVPDMHVLGIRAVNTDTRSVDFRQSVDIVQLDAENSLDTLTHCFAPSLGTDDTLFQVDFIPDTAPLDLLSEEQSIGGCGAEDCGLQVHHHLQLLLCVAGSHRNRHRAELLAAVLETDARGPETVARSDVDAVLVRDARCLIAALEHLAPVVDILGCIRDDDREACGAR